MTWNARRTFKFLTRFLTRLPTHLQKQRAFWPIRTSLWSSTLLTHPIWSRVICSCRRERRLQSAPKLQEKQLAVLHAIPQRQFRRCIQKRRDLLHKLGKRQGAVTRESIYFVIDSVRKLLNTPWCLFFLRDLLHREYIKCVEG
jgi:hypothetical protein